MAEYEQMSVGDAFNLNLLYLHLFSLRLLLLQYKIKICLHFHYYMYISEIHKCMKYCITVLINESLESVWEAFSNVYTAFSQFS